MARFARPSQTASPRQMYVQRYNSARYNLLIAAGFTVINVIMLIAKTFSYFLFSANVPYVLVDLAMDFCGMYPAEYYGEYYDTAVFWPKGIFYIALAIAIVIIALYVLCFLFSKNYKVGWLICALAMFAVDTVCMLLVYNITIDMIVDVLFHVWVLAILIMGIVSYYKLKNMPPEELPEAVDAPVLEQAPVSAEEPAQAEAPAQQESTQEESTPTDEDNIPPLS